MTNDQELQWIDAWNGAYGIPPDSLTAQHMRSAAESVRREQDETPHVRLAADFHDRPVHTTTRERVAARLAAATLHREWYGSLPSDKPGIERAIAAKKPALPEPLPEPSAKPYIAGLLTVAP